MSGLSSTAILTPAVAGVLLFSLTKGPDQYKTPLIQALSRHVSSNTIRLGINALKTIFALGLVRNVNAYLSELAQNNFRLRSEKDKYDWPNETAIITGAASGFGALLSKDLASHGINVMAVDIVDKLPEDMANNPKIHYYRCDVTDADAVNDLAVRIRTEHAPPAILINNAGIAYQHKILEASPQQIRKIFDVNAISHYFTLNAFLPDMIAKHKGHVVALASMASFLSNPDMVSYCQTKASVLALHEGLAQELRIFHNAPEIKLTVVHPIFASTPMIAKNEADLRKAGLPVISPQTVSDAIVKQILSCRGGQIILGAGFDWLAYSRSFPHWVNGIISKVSQAKSQSKER